MKSIVWGRTIENAARKLEEIEYSYKKYSTATLEHKIKSKNRCELIYTNGDHWIALGASESARGRKCNISYIDAGINSDIIDCIIKPSTSAGPYQGFHYYYDFV